jgi:glycosyltransferase involved in cell wall biosynthesis
MKILFLLPYPLQEAPSQRFRFEQYFSILKKAGYQIQTQSFLSQQDWKLFFKSGQPIKKLLTLSKGCIKRGMVLFTAWQFNYIFIHREATPLGPPIIEWILAKILRKKILYDFDDAIWLTDRKNETALLRLLKWRGKVKAICKWSYKVSCGNTYLQEYALQFNRNAIVNPTTIDSENIHKLTTVRSDNSSKNIVIGWTGSHSTLKYLNTIEKELQKLELEFDHVSFLVIADQKPALILQRLKFLAWNAQSEIDDLLKIDIGIMPLPDDEWAKGKCGFKALQYMALQIPAVVSAVGVNTQIISNGIEGFLCTTKDDWLTYLRKLITDSELRNTMGKNGRKKVEEHYSVTSNSSNFVSFFS